MFLLWLTSLAFAGQVYINGVLVHPPQVADTTLEKVDVTFDAAGNVRISAPGYKIEVVEPPPGQAVPAPRPVAQGPQPAGTFAPQPAGSFTPPATPPVGAAATAPAPRPAVAAPSSSAHPSGLPRARWWLVTEDNGSKGHVAEVFVNGELVQTIRSGESTRIVDVGGHLKPGANHVRVRSESTNPSGGALYVYLGSGSDESGTVVMDTPQVQYALGTGRSGPYEREYTLNAD